jgi:hypothetical protein
MSALLGFGLSYDTILSGNAEARLAVTWITTIAAKD